MHESMTSRQTRTLKGEANNMTQNTDINQANDMVDVNGEMIEINEED